MNDEVVKSWHVGDLQENMIISTTLHSTWLWGCTCTNFHSHNPITITLVHYCHSMLKHQGEGQTCAVLPITLHVFIIIPLLHFISSNQKGSSGTVFDR